MAALVPERLCGYLPAASQAAAGDAASFASGVNTELSERRLSDRLRSMRRYEEGLLRRAEAALNGGPPDARRAELERSRRQAEGNLSLLSMLEAEREASLSAAVDRVRTRIDAEEISDGVPAADRLELLGRAEALLQDNVKPAVAHLLSSLGIDLDAALSASETRSLVQALLTCTEGRLAELGADPCVPVAAKIVVRRLLADAAAGDMSSLEALWDRFHGRPQAAPHVTLRGSAPSAAPSPRREAAGLLRGELPADVPLSREAYVLIREMYAPGAASAPDAGGEGHGGR